jgi:hypothetical protein
MSGLAEIEKLYQRYKGNSRVSFWAVDVQENGETPEKAQAFMRNEGYTLPIALGSEKSSERLNPPFAGGLSTQSGGYG